MALYQSFGGATLSGYTKALDGNQLFNKFDQRIRRKRLSIPALYTAHTSIFPLVSGTDQIAVIPVFSGELVKAVYFRIITAGTLATCTLQVLDNAAGTLVGTSGVSAGAASAAGGVWTGAIVCNGTAGLYGPQGASGSILANGGTASVTGGLMILAGLGKYYTANGSIDVKVGGANITSSELTLVVEVIAEFLELVPQATN